MEELILKNPEQYPTDEVVFSYIGDYKSLWNSLFDSIHIDHPEFSKEWRYYKDGKSWLMKVTKKKKTVFWLSVLKDTFNITFYFTDKAQEDIYESSIPDEIKERFKNSKYYNRIRGLRIKFKNERDVEYTRELITIKLKFL